MRKIHEREFGVSGIRDEEIKQMRLAYKRSKFCCHIDQRFLFYFPHSFIKLADKWRDLLNLLDGSIVGDDSLFKSFPGLEASYSSNS